MFRLPSPRYALPVRWVRRLAKGIWALLLVLALLFQGGDTFGAGNPILQIARPHLFSTVAWEVRHLPQKWFHAFGELFRGSPGRDEEVRQVRRFFELTERTNDAQERLDRAAGGANEGAAVSALEAERDRLRRERGRLQASVERIMEGLITAVLREEGISSRALFVRTLWPPVDFSLGRTPRVLIVSPRNRIELAQAHLLDPDITLAEAEALERVVDGRNLSSLVEGTGGVATYPSLVPDGSSLRGALETASHEWTHQYLFFHPLGRAYRASTNMTTVNETVADMVGKEIGEKVYRRFFATPDELSAGAGVRAPAEGGRPAFDFNGAMRETRLEAERLLAAGKVEEAEAYMEQRRLFLADHGYFFRKINQAFFAFHGTYAGRPGAVSPIGGQLRSLRDRSPTLRAFLSRVAGYGSFDAFQRDVVG